MGNMTHEQISEMNKKFFDRRNSDLEKEEEAAQEAVIDARNHNAAQPKGMWDAGSQTWTPEEDPTHGKASRKYYPGGMGANWEQALAEQRNAQQAEMYGSALADQMDLSRSADDTFAAIQQEGARRQMMANNVLGVVMSQARRRFGGQITPELATWANNTGGFGDAGIVGGGRQKDGSFVIKMADGQVVNISLASQIGMAHQLWGTSDDNDRATLMKEGAASGLPKNILQQLSVNPLDKEVVRNNAERMVRQRYMSEQERGRDVILRSGNNGGPSVGTTDVPRGAARSLFGFGGDNHSRISFFSTGGAGTGWTRGVYDGRTGEWTEQSSPDRIARDLSAANPDHPSHFKSFFSGSRMTAEAYTDENGKRHEAQYENGKIYRNDITGEEVWVPDGSSLRQVMANAQRTASGRNNGRSAEDQIAIEEVKNKNAMQQIKAREDGKNGRLDRKIEFDEKKFGETLKLKREELEARRDKAESENERKQIDQGLSLIKAISDAPIAIRRQLDLSSMLEDIKSDIEKARGGNKATIKSGDNSGYETQIPEFDPNKKDYKVGDRFVRNGIEYEVGSDEQPHKVSK